MKPCALWSLMKAALHRFRYPPLAHVHVSSLGSQECAWRNRPFACACVRSGLRLVRHRCLPACRAEVLWETGAAEAWYPGVVSSYSEATESHLIVYEDGDSKWHAIRHEETMGTLRWVDPPAYHSVSSFDDSMPHYLVYNADTRALFTYPNVTILEDADIANPVAFAARLAGPPHSMYVPSGPGLVRQLFVKVSEPCCKDVPHVCAMALQKHAAAAKR